MQPNGGLSHLTPPLPGQQNNWLRPSVQQILMQQAFLQQQQNALQARQMPQASPMIRPGDSLNVAPRLLKSARWEGFGFLYRFQGCVSLFLKVVAHVCIFLVS